MFSNNGFEERYDHIDDDDDDDDDGMMEEDGGLGLACWILGWWSWP